MFQTRGFSFLYCVEEGRFWLRLEFWRNREETSRWNGIFSPVHVDIYILFHLPLAIITMAVIHSSMILFFCICIQLCMSTSGCTCRRKHIHQPIIPLSCTGKVDSPQISNSPLLLDPAVQRKIGLNDPKAWPIHAQGRPSSPRSVWPVAWNAVPGINPPPPSDLWHPIGMMPLITSVLPLVLSLLLFCIWQGINGSVLAPGFRCWQLAGFVELSLPECCVGYECKDGMANHGVSWLAPLLLGSYIRQSQVARGSSGSSNA